MKYTQIDRTNCMQIILQEFPTFQDRWNSHLDSWTLPFDRPVALDVREFTEFAIELIRQSIDTEIDRLSEIIELMLVEGDSVINYTFRMMFLKNIAECRELDRVSIDRFIAKFQPATAYYCKALDIFLGDIPLVLPEDT